MSKELFHATLSKQFYLNNKDLIVDSLFEDNQVKDLYRVVKWAYDEQNVNDLSVTDLKTLYEQYYPTVSETKKTLALKFIDQFDKIDKPQDTVSTLALKQAMMTYKANEAATMLINNKDTNSIKLDVVREILQDIERISNDKPDSDIVDMDINSLVTRTGNNSRWKFNIPSVADYVDGIGAGSFSLIAGRVESGKSLTAVSFCFSPGGFADQGAKVLYLCNEEDGAYTGIRAVSSYSGMTIPQIRADKLGAISSFAKIKDNVIMLDNPRMSMGGLERLIKKYSPDIVVVDQLDNLSVSGDFARDDLRLGRIYRQARELAKLYQCAFIGVSQTSAESDGKMHYGFDALAGSKTDKPAACDLIMLIGKDGADENGNYSNVRAINIAKNKITGRHGAPTAVIHPEISRLVA